MKTRHQTVPSVYLILLKDDQVLLGKRRNTNWQDGKFGLVSGHVEAGESATAALIREAEEEAGIIVQPQDLQPVCVMYREMDRSNVDFFFACRQWQGAVVNAEPDKCEGWEFYPLQRLPDDIIHYLKVVIESCQDFSKIIFLEHGNFTDGLAKAA